MIVLAEKLVFGIPDRVLPIVGLPEGRSRLRLRNTSFASVWVRTEEGIKLFMLLEKDKKWHAVQEQGRNITINI